MSSTPARLEELLIDRATVDLGTAGSEELDALLVEHPECDAEEFELAAAAVHLALQSEFEPIPDTVRARLARSAEHWQPSELEASVRSPRWSYPAWGWWTAAAAVLIAVVALSQWWPTRNVSYVPSLIEQRQMLLTEAPDAVELEWGATDDPAAVGASGNVVWSEQRQEGYMTIRGLEVNDPSRFQYQLWVFDAARDERYPVDGGVFDVTRAEVVVPIHATLPVSEATLFAVTLEKPGGVVVSDRSRIVLAAASPHG